MSDTLGRDVHEGHGDPGGTPTVYKARIISVAGTAASVIVPWYSEQRDYDGVPFMPRGATDPSAGDEAWVAFDEDRNPVIVCWRPA
jgi:hypothetical protein